MGKRELLLILLFVLLGAGVYWLTAPSADPGVEGFSVARMFESVRREVSGNQASAERTTTASEAVAASITELRINVLRGPITVIGEDRDTVASELNVRSSGYDEAEALQLATETVLQFEHTGSLLIARVEYPKPGRQTASLTLRVPSRLRIRIEGATSTLDVSGVTAVEAAQAQGETTIRNIGGRVSVSHRAGKLLIADAGSLRLTTRGSNAVIENIRAEAEVTTQAGGLTASAIRGPLELNASATRLDLTGAEQTEGIMRITVAGGTVTLKEIATESRIDLRNTPLNLHLARPAEVAVFSEGDAPVRVTLPGGGFRLDAQARSGRITSEPQELFTSWGVGVERPEDASGERLTGTIHGGGPLLTIRARADIAFAVK